ncbi:MAG: thioredoxin-dependent thiol peroxidase [Chitinophagaceae bacterium]|nr:thioredoxin-dependent thiol peroxidase [Chitinophagaceae bacterium]
MPVKKKAAKKKSAAKKEAVKPIAKKTPVKKTTKKAPFKNYQTRLKAGDKAPVFNGVDQDGKKISMADYRNKKLVLYFYPEDDTPTCTTQACNLRDNYSLLRKKGIEITGVSKDGVAKHKKFEAKYHLPFRLIADEKHEVIDAYDVWGKKQFMGKIYDGIIRTTFLINEAGVIEQVINRPATKSHAEEILELWGLN